MTIRLPEFSHPPDQDYQYVSDPMGRIGRGTWRRRRKADPFGRTEADWEFEALRKDFDPRKPLQRIFRDRSLDLAQPVGRDADNDPFDVALIETLLAKTGLFDLGRTEGPTGHYGAALEDAIRRFQKSENLEIDGRINPGGPTLAALNARLAEAEGANNGGDGGDGGDKDATPAERKPADLLELAMRRGGGGARGRRPMPPAPPVDPPRRPDPARRPPADSGDESGDEPDAAKARREALADDFVKELLKPLEAHRGDDTTKKGNDIVARECKAILKEEFPDLLGKIEHIGGATKDGKGETTLPEKYVPNKARRAAKLDARPGSSHPDLTWRHEDDGKETRAHANTVTTKKDGETPTTREQSSFDRLVENVGAELATAIPKLRPGMDEDDYRETARAKCREIFGKLRDKLERPGDGKPEPEADEP
jgi:peptidoglycan hydrolase-like protein with peptidoglycan-binding domain